MMPGVKGMHHSTGRVNATRRKIWQSMRILRRFSLPDVCRTVPAVNISNVRKFAGNLERHGYIEKTGNYTGGRPGEFQLYRLVQDIGPNYPTICNRCGQPLAARFCDPKEKEKETKEQEQPGGEP